MEKKHIKKNINEVISLCQEKIRTTKVENPYKGDFRKGFTTGLIEGGRKAIEILEQLKHEENE